MTANVLFLSTVVTQERLSWIEEVLKFHYQKPHAEGSGNQGSATSMDFVVFLTGDALYSLNEAESRHIWSSMLSLPQVRLICDRDALDIRGISLDPLRESFPDQVSESSQSPSFWAAVISQIREGPGPVPPRIGWLQISSPYMFPSAGYAVRFLSAALDLDCGVSLYAYLDGSHISHIGQNPGETENRGTAIETLGKSAAGKNLPCTVMVNRYCASKRGYESWDDGLGTIGSLFVVRPAHIKDLDVIIRHSKDTPVLLSENAGYIHCPPSEQKEQISPQTPSVVILITHTPYTTEYAYGGVAFAVACAHQGIQTTVVFLEDGIFALTGEHRVPQDSETGTLPKLISHLSGNDNLHFYALTDPFHRRGISKHGTLAAIKEIDLLAFSTLLFDPPDESGRCRPTRILFF